MAEEHTDPDLPCSKEPEEKIGAVSRGTSEEKTEGSEQAGRTGGSTSQTSSGKPSESAPLAKSDKMEHLAIDEVSESAPLSPGIGKSSEKQTKSTKSFFGKGGRKSGECPKIDAGIAVVVRPAPSVSKQEMGQASTSRGEQGVKEASGCSSGVMSCDKQGSRNESFLKRNVRRLSFKSKSKPKKEEKQPLIEEEETEHMDTEVISRSAPSAIVLPKKEELPKMDDVLDLAYKEYGLTEEETESTSLDTSRSEEVCKNVESPDPKPMLLGAEVATEPTSSVSDPSNKEKGVDMHSLLQVVQEDDDETGTQTTSEDTTPSEEVCKQSIESLDAEVQRSELSGQGSSDALADVSSMEQESESSKHDKKTPVKRVRKLKEEEGSSDDDAGDVYRSPRKRPLQTRSTRL